MSMVIDVLEISLDGSQELRQMEVPEDYYPLPESEQK